MKTVFPSDDPVVRRMDEICEQLTALYSEAAQLIDPYVDAICRRNHIPEDLIRQRTRRRLEDA